MKPIRVRLILICATILLVSLSLAGITDARIRIEDVVGMWLFDEIEKDGPRRLVRDFSGRGHDGIVIGDPQLIDGKFGKALVFGKGRYVEVPHHEDLRITDVITISTWVKRPLPKAAKDLGLALSLLLKKVGFGHLTSRDKPIMEWRFTRFLIICCYFSIRAVGKGLVESKMITGIITSLPQRRMILL